MAQFFQRFALTTSQDTAEDGGDGRVKQAHLTANATFATDPQPNPQAGLLAPIAALYDVHLTRVTVYGNTPTAEPSAQDLIESRTPVLTHIAATAGTWHSNPTQTFPGLSDTVYQGIAAMEVEIPRPYVRLSGNALALWAVAPAAQVLSIDYETRYPDVVRSHAEFGSFVDNTVDVTGVAVTSLALLNQLELTTGQPWTYTAPGTTTTIQIAECLYAAPGPTGEVWVRGANIGPGSDQIPTSAAQNTVSRYTFHPVVFMRRLPRATTGLVAVGPRRAAAINVTRGPLAIWEVVRSPTHSRWGITLDGVPRDVTIAHPTGSDFRTPTEIWRGVWVPLLRGTQGATAKNVPIYDPATVGASGGASVIGQLDRTALGRMDYARFLEPMDGSSVGPIVSLYAQTV